MLGRELEDLFPVAFLPENQSLAVAVMSYNGRMDFGLLGDYDALPDIEDLGDALRDSLAELVEAAGGKPSRAAARAATPACLYLDAKPASGFGAAVQARPQSWPTELSRSLPRSKNVEDRP